MRRRWPTVVVATMLVVALSGCAAPASAPTIAPSGQPARVIPATTVAVNPTPVASLDAGPSPGDLRDVVWSDVAVPGAFCAINDAVALDEDQGKAVSQTWGSVQVDLFHEEYGNLLGDDGLEAAVTVLCENGGGTGAGVLQYALVVYADVDDRLLAVGTLVPQRQLPAQLPTLVSVAAWGDQHVVVEERWYRSSDSTCCPSGVAETTWTWVEGNPVPGATHIIG